DIEFRNPYVMQELKKWGKWYVHTTGLDGLRLDAVKHISPHFFNEWLGYLEHEFQRRFFCIAEYWNPDVSVLEKYIDALEGKTMLFDVPLHHNFYEASIQGGDYDMRCIFDNSLL